MDIDNYVILLKFSDDECVVIVYVEVMIVDLYLVIDEQVVDLWVCFGEVGVIELIYQIGVENM